MTDPQDSRPASPGLSAKADAEMVEAVKEREFYRYHRPQTHSPDTVDAQSPLASSLQTHCIPALLTEPLSPFPSDDTALTAFAQLGALRLNARRCMISFFDRKHCYILAEATRTLSLQNGKAPYEEDGLAWGTSKIPRSASVCRFTVKLRGKSTGPQPMDERAFVVPDFLKDDRFQLCPFVVASPNSRFYAGVPIKSPQGHNIGTYCVMDDKPRDVALTHFEVSFLEDMGVTVMRHLQMSRASDDHRRGGIMVRSLGSFAEGKSNLEDWWQDSWEPEPTSATSATFSDTALEPRQRRPTTASGRMNSQESIVMAGRATSINSSVPSATSTNGSTPSSGLPDSVNSPISDISPSPLLVEVATKSASSAIDAPHQNQYSPEIQTTFSRAAKMILEATEAEGTVFFDAKISTFGGLVDDEFITDQPELSEHGKPCGVLGAALWENAVNLPETSNVQYSMLEGLLRHLVRTYPHGQIFNFDQDDVTSTQSFSETVEPGTLADAPASSTSTLKRDSAKCQEDENLLRDVFPKARSLVLYPLWDAHRERWFAGAVIWSSDPMRVFTSEQELSYLAAFSNSVMAEVARLDTQLADSAKADFISSISHELRSPLHGILGTTELLRDTQIDHQQSNMAQTIETCGKTLLDTINHVLDFAKINNLTRGVSKRSKKRSNGAKQIISPGQGHTNDIMTLISDVDLSILTEEVLETVFAGYNFQKTLTQTLTESTFDNPAKSPEVPQIAIIVDINKTDNYVFRTQPGAWRRVLMNLFGNALKYTPAGYIKIKLQVTRSSSSDELSELRFIITDSGIGMSEDYVNNRLFHSFAQENSLSQGTGLGLSIVKQIVESLGGEVEVRSAKGKGSKFTVYCPLKQSILSPTVQPSSQLSSIAKRTSGMIVEFLGFDDKDEYFPVKSLKNKNATRMAIKALDNLCTDWFGMNVQIHGAANLPPPDLFVASESGAKWLRAQYSKNPTKASTAPVIVICQGAASAQSTTAITVPGQIFECIAQPCGPHKLAKALSSCLDRHAIRFTVNDSTLSNVSKLTLQENTPPMSPTLMSPTLLDAPRPHFASALSAPELHSLSSSPVKKVSQQKVLHCLAVDDNPINLRLLRMFIEKLNYRHTLAVNGLEALEIYKASNLPGLPHPTPESTRPPSPTSSLPTQHQGLMSPPLSRPAIAHPNENQPSDHEHLDVILMDINMPILDGLEATRQIRAHERDNGLSPVTIIALTGVASSEAQQEAHVSGVNLFLIKPVRLGDLEVVLKGVV